MGKGAVHGLGRWTAGVVLLLLVVAGVNAQQEPPARVGRIATVSGDVQLFDTETQQWVAATRNRPFAQGERLAVGAGAAAELQVGGTALVLDSDSELAATRLDNERLLFSLVRGSVGLRMHEAELVSRLELATPEAGFLPLRAGLYRVDRRSDGSSGSNWRGLLRATTSEQVLTVEPGRRVAFAADAVGGVPQARWSSVADDAFSVAFLRQAELAGATPAFVSPEMTGVAELERHGSWQQHPEFGWAWSPAIVAPQWAPYRFGQWVWVQPWGWTWVDAAPWGFAPFRYGQWFWWGNRWSWAPGPGRPRPVVVPVAPGVIGGGRPPPPPMGWMPPGPRGTFGPGYGPPPVRPVQPPPGNPPGARPKPPPVPGAAPGPFYGRPVGSAPPAGTREPTMRPVSPPVPVAANAAPPVTAPVTTAAPAAPKPPPTQAAGPFKPDKVAPDRRPPAPTAQGRERQPLPQ